MDILWHCLVEDAECYDDALHWFLNQVRSKDQHAMGMETYKHLFLEKVRTATNVRRPRYPRVFLFSVFLLGDESLSVSMATRHLIRFEEPSGLPKQQKAFY